MKAVQRERVQAPKTALRLGALSMRAIDT